MSDEENLYDQAIEAARRQVQSTSPGPPRSFHRILALLGFGAVGFITWRGALHFYDYWCKNLPIIKWTSSGTITLEHPQPVPLKQVAQLESENNVITSATCTPAIEYSDSDSDAQHLAVRVVIHQRPRGYYTPCVSPFPLKLETFLRVARIPYEVDFSPQSKSSSKPSTWIELDGTEIVEPHQVIPELCETFGIDLEKSIRQQSRLTASRLVGIMLENHIFWGIALWRWVYDHGKSLKHIQPLTPMTPEALNEVAESVTRASWYHGFGRMTQDDVIQLVLVDLADLSAALGNHDYFLGQQPGNVDCDAFAMLAQMLWNMPNSPFEAAMKKHINLQNFVLRMRERFWPDWDDLLEKRGQDKLFDQAFYPINEFQQSRVQISTDCEKNLSANKSKPSFQTIRPVGLGVPEKKGRKNEAKSIHKLNAEASSDKEHRFSHELSPVSPVVVEQEENLRCKVEAEDALAVQRLNLVNHNNPGSFQNFTQTTLIHLEHDQQFLPPNYYTDMPQMYVNQLQQFSAGPTGVNHPYFANAPFRADFVLAETSSSF